LADAASITPADIEKEHREALASLTPEQRLALDRLATARQRTNFNGRFPQDNLRAIFAAEAEARNTGALRRRHHPALI
jgi:hypothetical protein